MQEQVELVFLGSVTKPSHYGLLGANIAMSKWLGGLLEGLSSVGNKPKVVGHFYEASWPRGKLWRAPEEALDMRVMSEALRFSNIPFVRNLELSARYKSTVASLLKQTGSTEKCLLTYNPYPWHLPAAHYWQKQGGKWINIVLDYDEDDLGPEWSEFRKTCGDADGQVFLSWWGFENYRNGAKLHLDSGISEKHFDCDRVLSAKEKKVVLYAGKISDACGSELMASAFELVSMENVEFRIIGKGQCKSLESLAKRDPRVQLCGYVDDEQLHREMLNADVFLNSRDPLSSCNRLIFPSKLLHYISYGKPIVSHWTDGLAPEYRSLLDVVAEANPLSLAQTLEQSLNYSSEELSTLQSKIDNFLENERSWTRQSQRLIDFCSNV